MKLRFPTYEELDDLPSLVNLLREGAVADGMPTVMVVPVYNAATAIEGLLRERAMLLSRIQSTAANDEHAPR